MPPAARIGDMHTCPMATPGTPPVPHVGGPIVKGMPTVITCYMPQARVSDMCICVGPPDVIAKGSASVMVGSLPAARIGDSTVHGGVIVVGAPTVIIGDGGGGGGGGIDTDVLVLVPGQGGFSNPGGQAKALIAAAKDGVPFSEICQT